MRKAQIFFIDFLIAIMIFSIIVFLYYSYYGNLIQDPEGVLEEMILDAKGISTSLMSTGLPAGWKATNVQRIGLTENNFRLNKTKLNSFVNLSYANATRTMSTRFEVYFFLEDENSTRSYIFGQAPVDQKYLVQIIRLVILDSDVYRMVLHLWQD